MNSPASPAPLTPLAQELLRKIRTSGPISFAEFMQACLYHPEYGYYSKPDPIRFADFYTSVDVHPIFARLLARQVAEMWEVLGRPGEFAIVEGAAGIGRLAQQFLDFAARELTDFYGALRYIAVEISAARRAAHTESLSAHVAAGRFESRAEIPEEIDCGCVLSNELFDAMPVHRVVCRSGRLMEFYVNAEGDTLCETLGPLTAPEIEEYFHEQGVTLREGQQAEVGLEACHWLEGVGKRLGRGFVLTVDYGYEARELYSERHHDGTALAYARHQVVDDFLSSPGEQDLTAHVSFTALDRYGARAGLQRTGLVTQLEFLLAMGRGNDFADLYEPGASEVQKLRARLLLKTLIHPDGMGGTFRVLVQHKGTDVPRLTGLAGL